MHTAKTLEAMRAGEFLDLIGGYDRDDLTNALCFLWGGAPGHLADALNHADRMRDTPIVRLARAAASTPRDAA